MISKTIVKSLIRMEMKKNLRSLESNRKFFYPLAEPTYNADEVVNSLNSMTAYSTTMWDKVKKFEKMFGEKYGGEAIMVNSGSSADLLISFGLSQKSGGPLPVGSEILVPSVTWPTHLWSLIMAGFKVKLIDIDPKTLNFDVNDLEQSITNDTKAIFLVHLLGNMGNMGKLIEICKQKNLILLEDCCEALGSKYNQSYSGTFGLASSFSFFFSHHLVTMEGGMVLTKDREFADRCRLLRAHGWARDIAPQSIDPLLDVYSRYKFVTWGFNVRPTEIQAGFGIEQLKKIDGFQISRDQNADILNSCVLKNNRFLETMKIASEVKCSWFAFPIIIKKEAPFSREDFVEYLEINGIETRPIVAGNLAKQPATKYFPEIKYNSLVGADFIHEQGLYIGIHPNSNKKNVEKVSKIIDNFCKNL